MIICHCRAVSDRVVHAVISGGALDLDEVAARCGAGSECGGCVLRIERLLHVRCPVRVSKAS